MITEKKLLTSKEYAAYLGISYREFLAKVKETPDRFAPDVKLGTYPLYYIGAIEEKLKAL